MGEEKSGLAAAILFGISGIGFFLAAAIGHMIFFVPIGAMMMALGVIFYTRHSSAKKGCLFKR